MYQFLNQHITDVLFYNILVWGSSANPPDPSCGVNTLDSKRRSLVTKEAFWPLLWFQTHKTNWQTIDSQQHKGIIKVICLGPSHFFCSTVQHKAKTHAERMRPSTVPQTDSSCSPPLMRIRWGTQYTTTQQHNHTHNIKRLHLMPVVGKDVNNTFKFVTKYCMI